MKVIGWRAWYADGSKYGSASTKWADGARSFSRSFLLGRK